MGHEVYANNMAISAKAADGKSICAFPDVCFTPPQTPATPPGVPIPYPNTGFASDTTDGSKAVKLKGKEVMLKNKSYFKKSTGDEAGCAPKKGIGTGKIQGKVYFIAWSMDVKVEGENVVRHLDMTTHNHASPTPNTPPWSYADSAAASKAVEKSCEKEKEVEQEACGKLYRRYSTGRIKKEESKAAICADNDDAKRCRKAQACKLQPQNSGMCCSDPKQQAHHLVEAHSFYDAGGRGNADCLCVSQPKGKEQYSDSLAPCVCAGGFRHEGQHGQYHAIQQTLENAYHTRQKRWTYAEARECGVMAHKAVNPHCSENCTRAQLNDYHKRRCGLRENSKLRTDPYAATQSRGKLTSLQKQSLKKALSRVTSGKPATGN